MLFDKILYEECQVIKECACFFVCGSDEFSCYWVGCSVLWRIAPPIPGIALYHRETVPGRHCLGLLSPIFLIVCIFPTLRASKLWNCLLSPMLYFLVQPNPGNGIWSYKSFTWVLRMWGGGVCVYFVREFLPVSKKLITFKWYCLQKEVFVFKE